MISKAEIESLAVQIAEQLAARADAMANIERRGAAIAMKAAPAGIR
jgi:hypothetical protein